MVALENLVKCHSCDGKGEVPNPDPYARQYPGQVMVYCKRCDGKRYTESDIVTAINQLVYRIESMKKDIQFGC